MFLSNDVLSEQNNFEKQKHSEDYVRDENFKSVFVKQDKKISNSNLTYSTTEYARYLIKCQPTN